MASMTDEALTTTHKCVSYFVEIMFQTNDLITTSLSWDHYRHDTTAFTTQSWHPLSVCICMIIN